MAPPGARHRKASPMKTLLAFAAAALIAAPLAADDKKAEFKAESLVGTWEVTSGKKAGTAVSDDGKKGTYVITKDTFSIRNGDEEMFAMKYTLDTKTSPVSIDMEITKGPGDAKGSKAKGIVEFEKDELKLCYDPFGGTRPEKFDGEKAYMFTLKKKAEKKDK
jgi:uncharacterized protein (TIGR03067 family)